MQINLGWRKERKEMGYPCFVTGAESRDRPDPFSSMDVEECP
jgi:hypothetical protein